MHGARCTAHGAWCCGPAAARGRVSPESRLSRSKVQLLCVVLVRCGCLARAGFERGGTRGCGCALRGPRVRRPWGRARAVYSVFGMFFGVVFLHFLGRSRRLAAHVCISNLSVGRSRARLSHLSCLDLTDQISLTLPTRCARTLEHIPHKCFTHAPGENCALLHMPQVTVPLRYHSSVVRVLAAWA